ncbi:hypothetical protein P0W64_09440 [Tsukamurella sp. 8F]|uniref:hypothetical protein n=1 Tax=unclassified Tsukamurella TaxID=2633480 RepID=UPI0023B8A004|nr:MULTISPECIES: hypothetical protein [unclassified Tsukamurella]MDF0529802.1 hypothetical protein [Tsukamurella sp. 8J]MDF0586994.1 hypothetical protein [Tsukamurella sp. 8F]
MTSAVESARPIRETRMTQARDLARTTPGILMLLAVATVVASVLVGALTAGGVAHRANTLDTLEHRSGPLAVAAQDVYRALSDADATANSGFLAGGQESPAVRSRYTADIRQAGAALALATSAQSSSTTADPSSPVAVLTANLPVYTGLVETARADNLQGLPVGAAYQREASHLMRGLLLPAAESLYRTQVAHLAADEDSAGGFPWTEAAVGLILIAVLAAAQWFVWRRSRRRLNAGLTLATLAATLSLLWVLLASFLVMSSVHSARADGSSQTDVLTEARIDALQARADETLTLVARDGGAEYEKDYTAAYSNGKGMLDRALSIATDPHVTREVRAARDAQTQWNGAHEAIRSSDDGGDYGAAVQRAIGTEPDGAASAFDKVDTSLSSAIAATSGAFERNVADAHDTLTGAVWGVIILAVLTAAAAVAGLWQRLKEYR